MEGLHDQEDRTSIEIEEGKPCGSRARLSTPPHDEGKATAGFQTSRAFTSSSTEAESRAEDQQPVGHTPLLKNIAATRVRMQDLHTKDFNYSRVSSKTRRNQQIDELDERLRQEQETSRRLRLAVSVLKRKLDAAEEGRRRSNALERAFFSYLAEAEALVLQRDRLMTPGVDETRAKCLEAARTEAHERLALVLRGEMKEYAASGWREVRLEDRRRPPLISSNEPRSNGINDARQGSRRREGGCNRSNDDSARNTRACSDDERRRTNNDASGACCWESESVLQAYRTAAAGAVRRLSSALFGRELLAVEAAKASAAERERMLEGRTRALFDSQVSLQVEKDKIESLKASSRAEVREAKMQLEKAREQTRQQEDMVKDAERVHSSLSWRVLSMQVARDKLSEAVGERLGVIQAAVRQRVGFLPWAVERAINDLVELCSAAGPSEGDAGGNFSGDAEEGLLLLGEGSSTDTRDLRRCPLRAPTFRT